MTGDVATADARSRGSTTSTSPTTRATSTCYLALATRTGGPILELAAGTGRLAVPLAAAGHDGHGRRPRPGDARRARRRAAEAGTAARDRIDFVEADLLGLELPGGHVPARDSSR